VHGPPWAALTLGLAMLGVAGPWRADDFFAHGVGFADGMTTTAGALVTAAAAVGFGVGLAADDLARTVRGRRSAAALVVAAAVICAAVAADQWSGRAGWGIALTLTASIAAAVLGIRELLAAADDDAGGGRPTTSGGFRERRG
jgi:hypothetical protein